MNISNISFECKFDIFELLSEATIKVLRSFFMKKNNR